MPDDADRLATLLSEGLDLCVRARKLDDIQSGEIVGGTKCATLPMWAHNQYERDLDDWEKRSQAALMAMGRMR